MYNNLTDLEKAFVAFQNRIDIIVSLEISGKLDKMEAYHQIKDELKILKSVKKQEKSNEAG